MTPGHSYYEFPSHETDALLGRRNQGPTRLHHLRKYMRTDIDPRGADILLLLCYVLTGLLDSSAVSIWGSFASMQTGNTVYLGLGLAGVDDTGRWLRSLVSIGGFCLGSVFFSTFHRSTQPPVRARWALALSFGMQTACLMLAATVVTVYRPVGESGLTWRTALPLGLVAFQSSGQAVASRVLQFRSLTSVVLTSVYCDLFSDLWAFRDPEQLRRLGQWEGCWWGLA
ncbi:hypothetical protein P168DRAFT_301889 [Aspergillus campestris IBT 28561]|uniref:DUF1275 domain protein n=1 Tax=Aspergillus campestris (strain IBT 28561) TaxID=1392248 RepID=A0A2I1DHN1_ASPC2|nr:uncharacterized protein P168DRAFT_301889 [Aspergillus campestris IBT 28561]PKY09370.1 hypothetical protein P168DRAFT_301889 [Aspergillus campestris IBT 28561]